MVPKRTVIELLALKLSGEATPQDLAELEELMAGSPESVYHEELLKQIFVDKQYDDDADTDFQYHKHRLKYQDDLVFAAQNVTAFNHFKAGRYLVAACSLVLILLVAGLFTYQAKSKANFTRYNMLVLSGRAEHKKVLLPDGTQVWLNADSKLAYDQDMAKRKNREVQLTGEAFFDVSHDKRHPFIIKTNKISVKVLGTAFNIRAYPKDQRTETTLLRGSIELTVNSRNTEKVILKPAEKFALIDSEAHAGSQRRDITIKIQHVDMVTVAGKEYAPETSWLDNQLVFDNETFEEIAPKLERWYHVKIEIKNTDAAAYRFTGVFGTRDGLLEALTAMKKIKPFNFKIKDQDVMIY